MISAFKKNTDPSLHNFIIKNKPPLRNPIAWGCKTCNKIDWADSVDPFKFSKHVFPEHVRHRGFDIGKCKGKMIPLFDK